LNYESIVQREDTIKYLSGQPTYTSKVHAILVPR